MRARIYVIYGQGGWWTSIGMSRLASRIAKQWGSATVTTHYWNSAIQEIVPDIAKYNSSPRILIGYSLGANAVDWVAQRAPNSRIDLGVCYDPSVLSLVTQPGDNIKRLLLYHNSDWEPEGHAVLVGKQVERTEVSMWHLSVCYSEELHQKTLGAIKRLLG